MARKSTGPWYWKKRTGWYCVVNGKRYLLVAGERDSTALVARQEYRRRFGPGADAVAFRVGRAVEKLRGEAAAGKVAAAMAAMNLDAPSRSLVADVLERAAESWSADHTDRIDLIRRIDWKALHRAIWEGCLAPALGDVIDVEKYRGFCDRDALDAYTPDECAISMLGGKDDHDKPHGEYWTTDILDSHGLPTDVEGLTRIVACYSPGRAVASVTVAPSDIEAETPREEPDDAEKVEPVADTPVLHWLPTDVADSHTAFARLYRPLIQAAMAAKVPGLDSANKIENNLLRPVFQYLMTGDGRVKGRGRVASPTAALLLKAVAGETLTQEILGQLLTAPDKGQAMLGFVHAYTGDPEGVGGSVLLAAKVFHPVLHLAFRAKLRAAYPGTDPDVRLERLARLADRVDDLVVQVRGLEKPLDRLEYLIDAVTEDGPEQFESSTRMLEDDSFDAVRYMWLAMSGSTGAEFARQYPHLYPVRALEGHTGRVIVMRRTDWKALHRAIHNGTLAPEVKPIVDEAKYLHFSDDPTALDGQTNDEAAITMMGGDDYHDKEEGEEFTVDILEIHGLPTDPKILVRIADAYPRYHAR